MKVLLVIDHFGSGGAQRQLVELACGLQDRGHAVEMFVYFPQFDFFRSRLDANKIVIHSAPPGASPLNIVRNLAKVMRDGRFDAAVSYLNTANLYAQLARIGARRTRLVVSERTSHLDDKSSVVALLRRLLYVLSDWVVANSESQAEWLSRKSWLAGKVSCIYNGVDLALFRPRTDLAMRPERPRLVGVGRIGPEKNILNLILALREFARRHGWCPEVGWAGSRDDSAAGQAYCARLDELLAQTPEVGTRWQWLGLQADVPALLGGYDALVLPSLYEGLPNVVCEALASGMPVLLSAVCDHPRLVTDGKRGFVFDPESPVSIADAIERLAKLDEAGWHELGRNARSYAVSTLGLDRMVASYERLLAKLQGAPEKLTRS